ncbi:MAG: NTP transferase domain-containing protein [archaeon]
MSDYKVCILAAGVGSRIGAMSNHINKAILPVNFKAAISYIIEKFKEDVEIVVAVGHKKETVIDYLSIAHPERKFTFVEIDKYVGPGTGPGYSLLQCKKELNSPFVFFAADTIVLEDIPPVDENWFGIAPVKDTDKYCTAKIKNNLVVQLDDKIKCSNKFAFIGLAGVKDHEVFFSALEKNKDVISGEIQVSNGFKKLIEKKLVPVGFTWFDTGSEKNYAETCRNFAGEDAKFDFSKGDEFLYFVNGRVIKYFADPEIVKKRVERANRLKGLCPEIDTHKNNFYAYKKIEGQTLYSVLNNQVFAEFLEWAKSNLWKKQELSGEKLKEFKEACNKFYRDKTEKRLKMFYEKTEIEDSKSVINGINVPPLKELIDKLDWDSICDGTPSNFHGDLQFDNILISENPKDELDKFVLLDWRQDFGGLTKVGDLYYDLAKMYGGMIISYKLIKEGMFSVDVSGASVHYNFHIKNDLIEAKEMYEKFVEANGFDLRKIQIITALIFLNMSPLHTDPFDILLYNLGKNMLNRCLNGVKTK